MGSAIMIARGGILVEILIVVLYIVLGLYRMLLKGIHRDFSAKELCCFRDYFDWGCNFRVYGKT